MKIKLWCDNGANIHSECSETIPIEDFGFTEDEWNELTEDAKYEAVKDWAMERFDFGFEELA